MQHADHFTRILNERENYKREKLYRNQNIRTVKIIHVDEMKIDSDSTQNTNNDLEDDDILEDNKNSKKITKNQVEIN